MDFKSIFLARVFLFTKGNVMARSMALRAKMKYNHNPSRTPSPVSGGLHSKKRKAANLKATKTAPVSMGNAKESY